ncbi:YSIRK-type signal peptide-containing protein [Staphylococcus epidermidis]|nr:YSIRK-type signal peptide-containing protein [Staphylococcus epidermidis]MCG1884231.1 YSIRK-type signal peptide-containing protein [Staphylococcus epidermidis]
MENKTRQKFGIRKFSVGVGSIVIGTVMFTGIGHSAHAAELDHDTHQSQMIQEQKDNTAEQQSNEQTAQEQKDNATEQTLQDVTPSTTQTDDTSQSTEQVKHSTTGATDDTVQRDVNQELD